MAINKSALALIKGEFPKGRGQTFELHRSLFSSSLLDGLMTFSIFNWI
jgi:hypothetical protein